MTSKEYKEIVEFIRNKKNELEPQVEKISKEVFDYDGFCFEMDPFSDDYSQIEISDYNNRFHSIPLNWLDMTIDEIKEERRKDYEEAKKTREELLKKQMLKQKEERKKIYLKLKAEFNDE